MDALDIFRERRVIMSPYEAVKAYGLTEFATKEYELFNTAPMHHEWDALMTEMTETTGTSIGPKFGLILAPFGHGKSFRSGVVWPTWALIQNPELRILNVAAIETQAKRQVGTSFSMFNEKYPHLRSLNAGASWSAREFTVQRTGRYQESSYTAMGLFGSSIVGGHWDLIIADDTCTQANTRTPYQRGLTGEFILMTLLGRLAPNGCLLIIGSRWHSQDFYNRVLTELEFVEKFNPPHGFTQVHKAIERWPDTKLGETEGDWAWHKIDKDDPKDRGWSWQNLMDLWSTMGPIVASLQMQNNPLPTEGRMLKGEWLHAYDPNKFPAPNQITEAVIPLDPAFSTEEPGDWCAASCLVRDRHGQIYLVDARHWHLTWTDFCETELESFYNEMKILVERGTKGSRIMWRILPEVNALGGQNEFRKWVTNIQRDRERYGVLGDLPMVGVNTSQNKETRFGLRSASYQNKSVLVAEHLASVSHPFFAEWVGFPEYDHDDLIDSADIGLEYLLRSGRGYWG